MLSPECVERIETEMAEAGGLMAADDHADVWQLLRHFSDLSDELEFVISLLTDAPLESLLRVAREEAIRLTEDRNAP